MAANPHGHGHNYVVEVSLAGEPDPVTGMVLDLKELKEILTREIVDPYDHRFLNYEVPPFDREIPTTENIARDIWRRINLVNLHENILPTRPRADLLLTKGASHRIEEVALRKL